MSRGNVLFISCLAAALGIYYFSFLPSPSGRYDGVLDTSLPPAQTFLSASDSLQKTSKDINLTITSIADYSIAGVVLGTERYYMDRASAISPIDVGLAWGELTNPKYLKYIIFSQSERFLYHIYNSSSPAASINIISLSSNNHIIPANNNVLKAVKSLKKGQKVILKGSLVNVSGKLRGLDFSWNTSTVREDSGNGACEILYLKEVILNNKIYK